MSQFFSKNKCHTSQRGMKYKEFQSVKLYFIKL